MVAKETILNSIAGWKSADIKIRDNKLELVANLSDGERIMATTEIYDLRMNGVTFKCASVHTLTWPDQYIEVYRELFIHPATSIEVMESRLMNKLKELVKERVRILELACKKI